MSVTTTYIASSEFLGKKMIEYGYAPEKINILPNAYFGEVPGSLGMERKHILYAGRLSPEKGVDVLVQAAKGLNAVVIIAGDGPEREHLQNQAKQIGVSNVHFTGFLSPTELNPLYQAAHVTVIPSRWYENGPLVILESYANGTPVIGTRIGAIPEFVAEGKTGFLFGLNDAADLHKVLENCINQPDITRQMGATALANVTEKYSPETYLKGLEDILHNVLK
jgi:glycosyltransferase involved in cell wall biosynthesis